MADVLFQALIVPHRSLSPGGVRWVVCLILASSMSIMLLVWLAHAWPVLGFGVIDIGLAVALLYWNVRRSRASELVMLTEQTLSIIRTDPAGRRTELRLPTGWLNVVMEEEAGRVPRVLLASHAVREEIGAVLGESERCDLAAALRDALWRMRNPIFDNPQLGEPMARTDRSP